MNVGRSYVACEQPPAPKLTYLPENIENSFPPAQVERVSRLLHSLPRGGFSQGVGFKKLATWEVVLGINGTDFIAVQPGSVAGKGDQVGQGNRSLT